MSKFKKHFKDFNFSPKGTPHQDSQQSKVKDRERSLKVREKWLITYQRGLLRLSADFSTKTWQAQREGGDVFKVLKATDCQLRTHYLANTRPSKWRRRKGLPWWTKAEAIHHHCISCTRITKDNPLSWNERTWWKQHESAQNHAAP